MEQRQDLPPAFLLCWRKKEPEEKSGQERFSNLLISVNNFYEMIVSDIEGG